MEFGKNKSMNNNTKYKILLFVYFIQVFCSSWTRLNFFKFNPISSNLEMLNVNKPKVFAVYFRLDQIVFVLRLIRKFYVEMA